MSWRALALVPLLAVPQALGQDAPSAQPPGASQLAASSIGTAASAGLSDAELEMAVRAAYTGAAAFASAHGNYFARDGVVPPLHDAVAAAVTAAYPSVVVPPDGFADLDAAKVCLATPGTQLRVAPTPTATASPSLP